MIRRLEARRELGGRIIAAVAEDTGRGLSVLVAGGDSAHIGSVTVAGQGGIVYSITFPGHRETIVSESWAERLSKACAVPVVVSAGIHYDNASRARIREILEAADGLLEELLSLLLAG